MLSPALPGSSSDRSELAFTSGPAYLHPVAAGVEDQGLGGPKAHGLAVEQAGQESRRVVQLEPGRRIDQVGETDRMALGETEIGKSGHLFPDTVGDRPGGPPFGHPGIKTVPEAGHALGTALGPHGLAQLVRLARGKTGHIYGHLHQLFLEKRYP